MFNENFTQYIALQNGLALILNFLSMIFRFRLITDWYSYTAGFWVVLSMFIVLNLFVLTSPRFVAKVFIYGYFRVKINKFYFSFTLSFTCF